MATHRLAKVLKLHSEKVKARVKERVRQREWERPARVRDVRRLNWQELQQKEERDANRWRWVLHRWMFRGLSY